MVAPRCGGFVSVTSLTGDVVRAVYVMMRPEGDAGCTTRARITYYNCQAMHFCHVRQGGDFRPGDIAHEEVTYALMAASCTFIITCMPSCARCGIVMMA